MQRTLIEIGSKIKLLREQSGFTQASIAKYLNLDQSLISKFEAGERSINTDKLEKMLILLRCDMSIFNEIDVNKPLSFALRANGISEDDYEIISAINKIALNSAFMTKLLEGEVH